MDSIFQQISHQVVFCLKISKSFTCILNVLVIYFATSIFSLSQSSQNMTLNCWTDEFITSPNYPSYYPNGASDEWHITAPSHRRILITFYDFNLQDQWDFMDVTDSVLHEVTRYTGGNIFRPPFLSQGYQVVIEFTSSDSGARRGFNISASCYEPSEIFFGRLMDSTSPLQGLLELRSEPGEWKRVCEESLSSTVARVVCKELGYPGVDEITYVNDTCLVGEKCTRAPMCQDDANRLEDCTQGDSVCTSNTAVKVKCKDVGYKGCYYFSSHQMKNGFSFKSKGHCISSCRKYHVRAIAIMDRLECFCSTADEIKLDNLESEDNDCASSESSSLMTVYSAHVGFCEELHNTDGGSWDSNITWFGSIVNFTCSDGYRLNGNRTIRCLPGSSPYYPVWNDSMPSCAMIEDNTQSTTVNMPVKIAVPVIVILTVFIIVGILVYFIGKNKCSSRYVTQFS